MSGALYPIAGSKLYIGGPMPRKGTVAAADFQGQVWTEIDGWANAGELGDTQNLAEQELINEKRVQAMKTTLNGGQMDNQFVPIATDPGQAKFKAAIADCRNYAWKVEWGADCMPSSVVTISVATPGVVTWTGHGLTAGQPVIFSNEGGALPTGLTAGTVYYVIASGLTANSFSVSATPGGTAINTTAAGSGTNTASAPPAGMTDLFIGLALPGARQGGGASDSHLRNWSIRVNSNILEI